MKKYLFLILIIMAVGCRSKKITLEKTIIKTDSIAREKSTSFSVPVVSTIVIDHPCDSLGNLRPFNQSFKSKYVNVRIRSEDQAIRSEINIDSLKTEVIKEYIKKNKSEQIIKTITIYRIPKWIWYILGSYMILIIYLFAGSWLKTALPFLKFLPF